MEGEVPWLVDDILERFSLSMRSSRLPYSSSPRAKNQGFKLSEEKDLHVRFAPHRPSTSDNVLLEASLESCRTTVAASICQRRSRRESPDQGTGSLSHAGRC